MSPPPFPLAGEAFSLLAAVVWAAAVVLLRLGGERVPPLALNTFKNALALVLLGLTLLVAGVSFRQPVPAQDLLVLIVSGLLGLGVADTLFLASLNRLGAGRSAVVDCLYSPFMFLCAAVWLKEPLAARILGALALVVLAVLVAGWEPAPSGSGRSTPGETGRAQVLVGVLLGALAMLTMSVGIVLAKPVLERTDAIWATTVRLTGGAALPALLALSTRGGRGDLRRAFTPGPAWRITIPAAVVGTYLSMLLWIAGMKFAQATVAAILNQTSTVFTLLLATLVLREPLTGRRVLAILLGCGGALLATLPAA